MPIPTVAAPTVGCVVPSQPHLERAVQLYSAELGPDNEAVQDLRATLEHVEKQLGRSGAGGKPWWKIW